MYLITYTLPDLKHANSRRLQMKEEQAELYQMISEHF